MSVTAVEDWKVIDSELSRELGSESYGSVNKGEYVLSRDKITELEIRKCYRR